MNGRIEFPVSSSDGYRLTVSGSTGEEGPRRGHLEGLFFGPGFPHYLDTSSYKVIYLVVLVSEVPNFSFTFVKSDSLL